MSVSVQMKGFDEAAKLLSKLQVELPKSIIGKALTAAAKPVVMAARASAPRSALTGTGAKQSKAQRAKSPTPLAETIRSVVRQYENVSVAVVGPSHPAGAHGHLVEGGHKAFYWGRSSGFTREADLYTLGKAKVDKSGTRRSKKTAHYSGQGARVEGKEFLAPAADSTQAAQGKAMVNTLAAGIKAAGG